ncbi:MAG: TMEM165/GDT1 family protein [Pseudomonadota bacterium]|nr:TMEM165/GDT1 family protein [Pseudomonadota bacterium]
MPPSASACSAWRCGCSSPTSSKIATVALAAGYSNLPALVAGTTCGMLAANAPVIFLGNAFAGRLPMRAIHVTTTILLIGIGGVFIIPRDTRLVLT